MQQHQQQPPFSPRTSLLPPPSSTQPGSRPERPPPPPFFDTLSSVIKRADLSADWLVAVLPVNAKNCKRRTKHHTAVYTCNCNASSSARGGPPCWRWPPSLSTSRAPHIIRRRPLILLSRCHRGLSSLVQLTCTRATRRSFCWERETSPSPCHWPAASVGWCRLPTFDPWLEMRMVSTS